MLPLWFLSDYPGSSATIPEKISELPEIVTIDKDTDFQANVKHYLVMAKHKSYKEKVLDILPAIQPYVCLVFANSNKEAAEIAREMRENGYDLVELHGDLEPRERNKAIRTITSQKKSYIVASDIASRGIDLEGVTHVISCGFPKDLKFYMHRAGRTGRAGRDGLAIAIAKKRYASR